MTTAPEPPHAGVDGEQAERGAEEEWRERERKPGADAVPGCARSPSPRRYREEKRWGRPKPPPAWSYGVTTGQVAPTHVIRPWIDGLIGVFAVT